VTSVDVCDSWWDSGTTHSPTGQGKTQVEGWGVVWWEIRCVLWTVLLNLKWKLWWESEWENKISDFVRKEDFYVWEGKGWIKMLYNFTS